MSLNIDERVGALSVRHKVALVLACADHVRAVLAFDKHAHARAGAALDLCWQWARTGKVESRRLYDEIHALLELETKVRGDRRAKSALFAAVSAVYYVTWHADREQGCECPERQSRLPNDMAEVGESDVLECMRYAVQESLAPHEEEKWQLATLESADL